MSLIFELIVESVSDHALLMAGLLDCSFVSLTAPDKRNLLFRQCTCVSSIDITHRLVVDQTLHP